MRRPRGVVGVISPWNWPYTMPAELVAPALACGNAVVWTPAPSTALCAVALARVHRRRRPAARRVQPRDRARARWSATRSPATPGPTASASSARPRPAGSSPRPPPARRALLEMGGNGPVVVLDDADVEAAVEATLTACFLCAGQSCTAGERILVHRAVTTSTSSCWRGAVTERIVLGDPFDDATTMGPLNNEPVAAEDGRARRRRACTRGAERGHRRRARERLPDRPVLAADRARRRSRRRARGASRRRSARSRRSSRSTRSSTRSRWPTPRPTACWRRSSPPT